MRAVMKYLTPRKLAALLALPLALAAAPLCEACPVNSGMAIKAPAASDSAEHACCKKKPQLKQVHAAEHCDNCVAKPAAANHAPELKAEFQLLYAIERTLPDATPFVLPNSTWHPAFFSTHSPPAVYLVQQKILL
ncbi:MAG: hypothetical protein OHK0011_09870 [Turneriella sp.]